MVGLMGPYLEPGPLPPYNHCGYETAIQMVLASRQSGKHLNQYTQWDIIRKLRSAYSNQVRAPRISNSHNLSIGDEGGKYSRITVDPCGSPWFNRCGQGCKRRMGQDWRPDRAISNPIMHRLMQRVEEQAAQSHTAEERAIWLTAGTYFLVCYVISLRGSEGLLLDLGGLRGHFQDNTQDYVILTLLGTVKGEHHERQHLLPAVNETSSGLQVKLWVRRLLAIRYKEGRLSGPAICDQDGKVMTSTQLNSLFHSALTDVFANDPSLFLSDVRSSEDIESLYSVFRSFRRGSDSRPIAKGVSSTDIEAPQPQNNVLLGQKKRESSVV